MTTLNPKPESLPAKRGLTGLLNKAWFVVLVPSIFPLVLESRRTGEAMRHPMDGPVTRRWRS